MQATIEQIAPGSTASDLGGVMSLNARLEPAGLVLRVHQPFVSRRRLLAVQEVRRRLGDCGLVVDIPLSHRGSTVFPCSGRLAELERYIPHECPAPTLASYAWMFGAMARLHNQLSLLTTAVPRPVIATYAPPSSLRRWLRFTASVVTDAEARDTLRRSGKLVALLRNQWTPATRLPRQLVHGDVRPGNLAQTPGGDTVYFDFGFLATRPRIHELAYSIVFMLLALGEHRSPTPDTWQMIVNMIGACEAEVATPLDAHERTALPAIAAAVPLYFTASVGCTSDPIRELRDFAPLLNLSEWFMNGAIHGGHAQGHHR